MWECTYCNSLKISRCNERSSGRAGEREREGNNSLKRTKGRGEYK